MPQRFWSTRFHLNGPPGDYTAPGTACGAPSIPACPQPCDNLRPPLPMQRGRGPAGGLERCQANAAWLGTWGLPFSRIRHTLQGSGCTGVGCVWGRWGRRDAPHTPPTRPRHLPNPPVTALRRQCKQLLHMALPAGEARKPEPRAKRIGSQPRTVQGGRLPPACPPQHTASRQSGVDGYTPSPFRPSPGRGGPLGMFPRPCRDPGHRPSCKEALP